MDYHPFRASKRALAVHLGSVTTVLALTGAGGAPPVTPMVETVTANNQYLASQVALREMRLEAPGDVYAFEAPSIAIGDGGAPGERFVGGIPASVEGNAVLEIASQYVGTPYVWGGKSPAGFDCSGFVSYVYRKLGYNLPASSAGYWSVGERITAAEAQPGDLVLIPGHVAIYAGGDLVIEAANTSRPVEFRTMWQNNPVYIRVLD